MQMTTYLLDLEGEGKRFIESVKNLPIIEPGPRYNELLTFIAQETMQQIMLIIDSDISTFPSRLATLPDFQHLEHFNNLRNPEVFLHFKQALDQLATSILFKINNKIGIGIHNEFLLEAFTEDYIVITKVENDPRYF